MKRIFNDKKNDLLIQQRNIFVIISILFLLIVFFQSLALFKKNSITILVPFGFNEKLSFSTNKVYNSYIEAISRDVISTMLNLTPNNIEYAEKTILSFADSSSYGLFKNQFEIIKKNIISKKFSTVFYPDNIIPDNSKMISTVQGTLYTYLGQKEVLREKKEYEIKFRFNNNKLTILNFSENFKLEEK